MKSYTADAMRSFDRRTIDEKIFTGTELMEQAGHALFRSCLRFIQTLPQAELLILAGKGNNGGDAFVLARLCAEKGVPFRLCCAADPMTLRGDAAHAFVRLSEAVMEKISMTLSPLDFHENTVVVDGLLGTGIQGEVRHPFAAWIKLVNAAKRPVIAIDVPSGLDSDTGAGSVCVVADLTVTMAGVKRGMLLNPGVCGRIEVARIGIPDEFLAQAASGEELFGAADAEKLLEREEFNSFKNRRGHLAVIGGSRDYGSAPFLSAEAALRSGAGLVTVALPASANVWCAVPKALIVRSIEDGGEGAFGEASLPELEALVASRQAVAVGPGMTVGPGRDAVLEMLFRCGKTLVIDADALNVLALNPELLKLRTAPVILTPHPGEMARLLKGFGLTGEMSRSQQAVALARAGGCVVVLKGSRTVVAEPDGRCSVNLSGCAALGTAGSGDVLTGVIGALAAQNLEAGDAARLGVYCHGLAGEVLSPFGSRGVIADDLPGALPEAFRRIVPIT